jgi:hypothetical protein
MNWLRRHLGRSALLLALLVVSAAPARAQVIVSGGFGPPWYGYGAFGYGYPGFGYGYGVPGYGYPGFGYGYGVPGYGYGVPVYGYGYGVPVYGSTYSGLNYPDYGYPGYFPLGPSGAQNPLFGLGLTPLGVQSALTERSLLGRGSTGYRSSPVYLPSQGPPSYGSGSYFPR